MPYAIVLCILYSLVTVLYYIKFFNFRGKQVGRHCYNIKICKCPTRDCEKEIEKKNGNGKGKRKSSSPAGGSGGLPGSDETKRAPVSSLQYIFTSEIID
jgi:hypothetical protein